MKNILQILLILCLITSIAFEVKAHDPDQISYHFMRFGEGAKLEVHLTPAGAFDLIKSLHADLNDSSIIRLSDYEKDLESYFNQTISLKLAGENVKFNLEKANLIQHDAALSFDLVTSNNSFEVFSLKISAFTEIYRDTENHVIISDTNLLKQFTLNFENQAFSQSLQETDHKKSAAQWPLALILSGLAIVFIVTRHYLRHQYSPYRTVSR